MGPAGDPAQGAHRAQPVGGPAEAFSEWTTAERSLVDYLRALGHEVRPGAGTPHGRRFDARVDAVEVEFKTLRVGATSATMRNRANESKRRGGQAATLIFDARGTGMDSAEARRGVARIRGAYSRYYDNIRVIGDGYDVTEGVGARGQL